MTVNPILHPDLVAVVAVAVVASGVPPPFLHPDLGVVASDALTPFLHPVASFTYP